MVDFRDMDLDDSDIIWIEDYLVPNVERGAQMLDRNMPGWAKIINTRNLDLSSSSPSPDRDDYTGCILCQIDNYIEESRIPSRPLDWRKFGSFTDAWNKINESDWSIPDGLTASDFGFDCYGAGCLSVSYPPPAVDDLEYDILDKLWLAEIERRLG